MTAGELLGFVPPAAAGALLAAAEATDAVMVAGLATAGVAEGAILGAVQASVLSRWAPEVDRGAWVRGTAVAAGFAWMVGMGGGALMGSEVLPRSVLLPVLVPAWAAGLLSMGFAQWRVLRRTAGPSARWIWVSSGAWSVGVMLPVAAISLAPDAWPGWARGAAGVVGAVAMGATVGALTAPTLDGLLDQSATAVSARSTSSRVTPSTNRTASR